MLVPADPVHAFVDYPDVPVANAASGPLAGLTFAVKGLYDVAGYVTGCGSPEKRADGKPAKQSAPVVQKFLDAGARFVGKVHMAELAFSLDGRNEHYGTPINPAAPDRVPGGSSSGSAASVAAGLVDFDVGSDTGGSVRGPASFCGVIGLRTTYGRIDISGAMPLAPTYDTVGWFTRDIALYERIGEVVLGDDVEGPPLARMVIADDAFALMEGNAERTALEPTVHRLTKMLASDGHVTVSDEGPLSDWALSYRIMQGFEAWRVHGPWITARKPNFNPAIAVRFAHAAGVTEAEYFAEKEQRIRRRARIAGLVGKDRVMVVPTMPSAAPRLAGTEAEFEAFRARALPVMAIAGFAGLPQITLPVGMVHGAPLGLSLIGPPGRDRALIALAARILAT